MFRRSFRRSVRGALAGQIPPALRNANALMAAGQSAPAAEIFEQFAGAALARNGPRAPWFFLQAGRARILAGQVPAGMAHFQQGLALFAARGQGQRLQQAGMRIVAELNEQGLSVEARQIEDYLQKALPGGFVAAPASGVQKSASLLPTHCPGCGGPLRSDEVEWADAMTAECPYCGSAVRAEG
jgi:hypothetical protein